MEWEVKVNLRSVMSDFFFGDVDKFFYYRFIENVGIDMQNYEYILESNINENILDEIIEQYEEEYNKFYKYIKLLSKLLDFVITIKIRQDSNAHKLKTLNVPFNIMSNDKFLIILRKPSKVFIIETYNKLLYLLDLYNVRNIIIQRLSEILRALDNINVGIYIIDSEYIISNEDDPYLIELLSKLLRPLAIALINSYNFNESLAKNILRAQMIIRNFLNKLATILHDR